MCRPNPCRHGGTCTVIHDNKSRQFSCDCEQTGYKGDLCEIGVVTPPDFPKLTSGNPTEGLELQAKPDNSLTVHLDPSVNLTIQPKELTIQHPSSKAEFQVTGYKSGVGMVSYYLEGVNKYDFNVPDNSIIFISQNLSSQNSVYTRMGLLVGSLPIECQKKEIENFPCNIRTVFDSNCTMSKGVEIESGPVHIITPDNKTIPLSLVGYNFSSPHPSRNEVIEKLVRHTGDQKSSSRKCSNIHRTARDLIEFIQKDAFPNSFLRYFTEKLPLWLKVKVREDNDLFDIENTLAYLVQATDAHTFHPICKFPNNTQSAVVLYRPTVNYTISVENKQLSLSSKGSCFAVDICETGVFLTLSPKAKNKVRTMQFMKDMADGGWDLLVSSFGFTTPRRYNRILTRVPDGHLAEEFSNFHYNLWWQGRANILLTNSSDFAVNMRMTGDVFAFAADLDAVSITCFFEQGSFEFSK